MPSLSPLVPRPFALDVLGPGEPSVPLSVVPFESVDPLVPLVPAELAPPEDDEPPEPPPELCAMANEILPARIAAVIAMRFILPSIHHSQVSRFIALLASKGQVSAGVRTRLQGEMRRGASAKAP